MLLVRWQDRHLHLMPSIPWRHPLMVCQVPLFWHKTGPLQRSPRLASQATVWSVVDSSVINSSNRHTSSWGDLSDFTSLAAAKISEHAVYLFQPISTETAQQGNFSRECTVQSRDMSWLRSNSTSVSTQNGSTAANGDRMFGLIV